MDEENKKNLGKNEVHVTGVFEGTATGLDTSDLGGDDGSVSEPSFSSVKKRVVSDNKDGVVEELYTDDELTDDGGSLPNNNSNHVDAIPDDHDMDNIFHDGGEDISSNESFDRTSDSNTPFVESVDTTPNSGGTSSEPVETTSDSGGTSSEPVETVSNSGSTSSEPLDSKSSEPSNEKVSSDNTSQDSSKSSGNESATDSKTSSDNSSQSKTTDNKSSNQDDKTGKKDDIKDNKNNKNIPKDADKAKDTAKKAKDTADKAKDAAKNAENAKKATDAAKNAKNIKNPKGNSLSDKAEMAEAAKDALKKGPKGAFDAKSIRAALKATKDTNMYSAFGDAAIKVLDGIFGSEKTDALLNKLGDKAFKLLKIGLWTAVISLILPMVFLTIAIYMVFAPLLDSLMSVKQVAINMANTAEKIQNLYTNGNFADSKETFYAELDRLGEIYGDDLDSSLLLTTLFYTDIKSGYQTEYNQYDDVMSIGESSVKGLDKNDKNDENAEDSYKSNFTELIRSEIGNIVKESQGTYDESTGFFYTVGKVYRLKLLADAMFSSTFGGNESNYNAQEITLAKWIDMYGKQFNGALEKTMKDLLNHAGSAVLFTTLTGIPVPPFHIKSDVLNAKILINCLLLGCMSIKSIDISKGLSLDKITIKYYTYKYSEENYKKFLREKYIPKNSDFKAFLTYDENGKPLDSSIEHIIDEIYEYKTYFDGIFTIEDEDDSENYDQLCIGAIDRKLASALGLPVDINTTNCIEFLDKNGYGYTSDGKLHNGIELNKESTGNVEGDKVYALMDNGTVLGSSADDSMKCTGGCIEIGYKYSVDGSIQNSVYDFSVIYKGLSKNSVNLKKDDKVTNKQQVGTIGTAAESEGLNISSLYLEFRTQNGTAIDPTNLIVKCGAHTGDYSGAVTIEIPQTFTQTPGYSITCVGSDGWHKSQGAANNYKCLEAATKIASPDKEIHDVWVKQGAKYKNGIAYIVVDGVERYLVAVAPRSGNKGIGVPGDVLNATLKNGTVLPLVVLDTKGGDKEHEWGHAFGSGVNVIEFEVDMNVYNTKGNVGSNWGIDWDSSSPVVKFTNNGNINSGKFDLNSNSATQNTSNGLKLCDSMYSGEKNNAIANKAIEMANNDTIGCTSNTSTRELNPDVDNASFIYYSVVNSSVMKKQQSVFTIDNMGTVLEENDFEKVDYKFESLKKGDIVVYEKDSKKVAVIYVGNSKQVYANPDKADTNSGDADGTEVLLTNFDKNLSYKAIYRVATKNEDPKKLSGNTPTTTSKLCGKDNEEKIWYFLKSKGYTDEAAAAIMGIWQVESSFIPNVVQRGKKKVNDKEYTAQVDNGTISRNEFSNKGPNGGGYGLAQWTYYTRKQGLYDLAKKRGKSIGDLDLQLEFFEQEMTTGYDWKKKKTKSRMNSQKTIQEAAEIFFKDYQGVLKKNFNNKHLPDRVKNANAIYKKYHGKTCK